MLRKTNGETEKEQFQMGLKYTYPNEGEEDATF